MTTEIVYARQWPIAYPFVPSIFLAGPTPRTAGTAGWRKDAIEILQDLEFNGRVFVPEDPTWGLADDVYEMQVVWEWEALDAATVNAFWIPRRMDTMPGLTTNTEYGMYWNSGKVVVGWPDGAEKNRYIAMLAKRANLEVVPDLAELLANAMTMSYHTHWKTWE